MLCAGAAPFQIQIEMHKPLAAFAAVRGNNMNEELKKEKGLSPWITYRYGMGEFGFTFFVSLVAYYLLFFMTDIAHIPMKTAGVLYALLQWVEAFTAIGAGILIDNMRLRGGRYRPWLLSGSILCMIGTVIFFTKFPIGTVPTTVVFTVFYCVAYAGFNCMWIAYRALIGIIGKTSKQTVSLTIAGTQLATVSSLLYSYLGVKLLTMFERPETGYTVSALVYGGIMVLSMLVVYIVAKPYDHDQTVHAEAQKEEKVSLRDMLRALPPLIPYGLSYILSIGASTLIMSCLVYYFNYTLGRPDLMSVMITVMTITRLAATFIVPWLSGKLDKKVIYIGSVSVATCFILAAYFLRANLVVFFALMGLYFASLVPAGAMFMPCVTDATDYNEFGRGIKARSFLYSVSSTFSYIAQFVGATAASTGLVLIGYDPLAAAQSPHTLSGIAAVTFLGTAALTALSIVPMLFYRLDAKTMADIYAKKAAALEEAEQS